MGFDKEFLNTENNFLFGLCAFILTTLFILSITTVVAVEEKADCRKTAILGHYSPEEIKQICN